MIKNMHYSLKVFHETEEMIKELNNKKNQISEKQYKKELKKINKIRDKKIKQIDKKYPLKKDLEELDKQTEQNNE